MKDLEVLSNDELLTFLANARSTAAMALGHGKAERNEMLASLYERELERRKVEIPSRQESYDTGIFNGPGST